MPHKVGRELRCDDQIDRAAICFAQVCEPPGSRVCKQLFVRIPLEGNADQLCLVTMPAQLLHQRAHVVLGSAPNERHLGLTDDNALNGHRWAELSIILSRAVLHAADVMADPIAAGPDATSVIVPAYNEAAAIGGVVSGLRSVGRWHEIL